MTRHKLGLGFAAALIAAAALGACTGGPSNTTNASTTPASTSAGVILTGDKALYAATAAYNGAGIAIDAAVKSGVLHGKPAGQVKVYYDQAYTALQAARVARSTGDTLIESEQATSALALIGQATALVPAASTAAPAS